MYFMYDVLLSLQRTHSKKTFIKLHLRHLGLLNYVQFKALKMFLTVLTKNETSNCLEK